MTNERKPPGGSNGQYKQLYIRSNRKAPYTDAKMGYDDYLHTNVWKELRNERLRTDFYRCSRCGSAINVEVHHIKYPDVWGTEDMDDLVTLCASCHAETHKYDLIKGGLTTYAVTEI